MDFIKIVVIGGIVITIMVLILKMLPWLSLVLA